MNVYFIRHAQSVYNLTAQDERNSELTSYGVYQSHQLTGNADLVILSPMKRAIQTYLYSNIKTKNIIISHLFREDKNILESNYLDLEDKNEETSDEIDARIKEAHNFLSKLANAEKIKHLVIFTHSGFINRICKLIEPDKDIIADNCNIISVTITKN